MRRYHYDLKTTGLVIAALALSIFAAPAQNAQAGDLIRAYDPDYSIYTPGSGSYRYSNFNRRARESTAAQRETSPISIPNTGPSLWPSGSYSSLQANQYENRVLANLRAADRYEYDLEVYRATKAQAEKARRDEQLALEKQRQEQARSRQAAMLREQSRRGVLFQALDKSKEATITQASNRTGAEAEAAPAKKGPKDASVWSRIKYIFLGA